MATVKIETTSRVDAVVNILTERIHDGFYPPGTKLPSERKLQEEFGVGRLALREALSRMNAVGIIETSHGRGTFVQDDVKIATLKNVLIPYFALNDSGRLKDFVEARGMIEGEIAWQAANKCSDEDIERLRAVLDYDFPPSTSHEEVAEQDLKFHRELARIVDNHFLDLMHEALTSHTRAFLERYVRSKPTYGEVMDAHKPILQAIQDGDAEKARKLARKHISFSMQVFEDFVEQEKGAGSE